MLKRERRLSALRAAVRRSRVTALVGPRQAGKTTLARQIVQPGSANYFDLENVRSLARLDEPLTALEQLRGIVVIDEVQRRPELFPTLRVLADRRPLPARFLILGSASPDLLRQSSETLAGRIQTVPLRGFGLDEVGPPQMQRHWRRGGFPPSWVARSESESFAWRTEFIQTFLERDIPQFGITIPATTLLRFWTMMAHYHGAIWNAAEAARSLGVSEPAARRYLDLLSGLFMIRVLQPWFENVAKRQVKSPKVYLRDSGLLHALLGLPTQRSIESHPKVGASWEGYAIEEVIEAVRPQAAYFWATHGGAELDLLLTRNGRRYGVEIKYQDAPRLTPSMRTALSDLSLEHLTIVYPGSERYPLDRRVTVRPLADIVTDPGAITRREASERPRAVRGSKRT